MENPGIEAGPRNNAAFFFLYFLNRMPAFVLNTGIGGCPGGTHPGIRQRRLKSLVAAFRRAEDLTLPCSGRPSSQQEVLFFLRQGTRDCDWFYGPWTESGRRAAHLKPIKSNSDALLESARGPRCSLQEHSTASCALETLPCPG